MWEDELRKGWDNGKLCWNGNALMEISYERVKDFISTKLAEQKKELIELLDGNKEVYTVGPDKGEEKDHVDSYCNETIDYIINQLKQD